MRALSDNQQAAFDKLKELKVGALFLGCGCGKTQTAVALINSVDDVDLVLWVCPCQTKGNVADELAKCGCRYPVEIVGVESIGQSGRIFSEVFEKVEKAKRAFMVCDESLKIKNGMAKRTKRMRELGKRCEYRLILNGTPITKNVIDIYEQMYFLSPKILRGMSHNQFRDTYCRYRKVKKCGVTKEIQITGYSNLEHLLSIIDPYIYQCTLDLGLSRSYKRLHWHMGRERLQQYREYKESLFLDYSGDGLYDLLAVLAKLQHSYCVEPEKFEVMGDLVDERTLIFCKYIESRDELERRFPMAKVMTYGTGSLGLNLQEYRRIIYFDKTFDYAFREQSEARIYRMGQQDDCEYFDLTGNVGLELMIDQCIDGKTSLVEHFKKGYRKELIKEL